MKQIFVWLREQMDKVKSEVYSPADVIWNNAVKMCLREVNEAEAKWEKDCCKWEHDEVSNLCRSSCNGWLLEGADAWHFNFCPYCGKRIKISEVE